MDFNFCLVFFKGEEGFQIVLGILKGSGEIFGDLDQK